ncbi:NAD-dependent epimerase/dehydratase family protein [Flavobacterium piscisymbiosum]|uniref:NAD-dependent epimerase/dehydratase family protein n=1 Tax=Flavobacterium piscisymbiosum TaxID=2893753 RepID=A0ABS8MGY9_9FLAO|nr:NAD-dependent epimerase/dehydratase family protein [Flavobacterium sp. F-30]MCC9064638.1 NAD-dependent epimerase/dehydratase family protein [Flavobacterium sp. F-30]
MKVIVTGATGMVGEGVLIECLDNNQIEQVLYVGRKPSGKSHPKLKEYLVPDFLSLTSGDTQLADYDACFYCAGISSVGMDEAQYTHITYDTTLHFAKVLLDQNPNLTFNFISGSHTDSSENGKVMWARVKGKTENALKALGFKAQYNFRPGLMKPDKTQIHLKGFNKYITFLYPIMGLFFTGCTVREIGRAMIAVTKIGYSKNVLEAIDIKKAANPK